MAASDLQSQPAPSDDALMVDSSLLEGMFERALRPTGAFAEELQTAGYDPKQLKLKYPIAVWRSCLAIACKYVFPTLAQRDAYRALGGRFVDGFFETLIGKLVSVGLPLMGVEGVIKRSPRLWKAGRKGLIITPVRDGERNWHVTFEDPYALPDFIAGVVYAILSQLKAEPLVGVENATPASFDLRITW